MGYAWTPWIFTLLAIVELVTDQLPSTPSRKVPMQFGARVVSGALSGATIGVAAGSWIIGLIAGVIGAVIGTFGGAEIRSPHGEGVWARPARSIHRGRRRHHPWAHHHLGAPMNRHFDAIVIGAGQAGPPMVGRLAAAGQKVALIERDLIGGTCVNTGCTPTKTLVASAYAAHLARRAMDFGVKVGPVGIDFAAVMARKNAVVGNSRSRLTAWLQGMANCTVIRGHARFLSPTTIQVGDDVLEAERFFINVGGRAVLPDFPGRDQVRTLTNTTLLELDALPRRLVVVGGSYVGLEFAQVFRRLGAEVTVVEKAARLVSREDEEVSDAIREILEAEGIEIRLESECIQFEPRGAEIAVGVNCTSGEPEVLGSHVLLAVGRRPNTDDLGLEAAGVKVDAHGYIVVDEFLEDQRPAHLGARRLQRPRRLHPHFVQ